LISAGAVPQASLGELTALPRPSSWILGAPISKGMEGREKGKDKGREGGVNRADPGSNEKREGKEDEGLPIEISGYATLKEAVLVAVQTVVELAYIGYLMPYRWLLINVQNISLYTC